MNGSLMQVDDDASHSSISDGEGDYRFEQYHEDPKRVTRHLATDSPYGCRRLNLFPYDPAMSPPAFTNFGQYIGRSTHLDKFSISNDGLDPEEDDICAKEHLEAFCNGLANNRSLRCLMMQEYDFSVARLEILHPFVIENTNLSELHLHDCKVSVEDIRMLSGAFSRRTNPWSIKTIGISGKGIVNGSVSHIIDMCNSCPRLRKLNLSYTVELGNQCCSQIATLLGPESKLKFLSLNGTKIDDEGALMLSSTIVGNKSLRLLHFDIDRVTARGLNSFCSLLWNTSSINDTFQSNHTLHQLCDDWNDWKESIHNMSDDLVFALRANEQISPVIAARQKIFRFHLNGNFDMDCFIQMDAELLPHVLGWIGKDYYTANVKDVGLSRMSAFYQILCNFPELCSYPSAYRKRMQLLEAEITALKTDVAVLKTDNVVLRSQNEHLMLENKELRSVKLGSRSDVLVSTFG